MDRIEALENRGAGFAGFAVIDIDDEKTAEDCKAEWIAENGPLGNRQWVIYDFRSTSDAIA